MGQALQVSKVQPRAVLQNGQGVICQAHIDVVLDQICKACRFHICQAHVLTHEQIISLVEYGMRQALQVSKVQPCAVLQDGQGVIGQAHIDVVLDQVCKPCRYGSQVSRANNDPGGTKSPHDDPLAALSIYEQSLQSVRAAHARDSRDGNA